MTGSVSCSLRTKWRPGCEGQTLDRAPAGAWKLAHISGRPVRITEDEFERYIRRETVRKMPPPKALKPSLDISAKARDIAIAMRHGGSASMAWIRRVDPKD